MAVCGRCSGDGYELENEGGREVEMPCYHCGTTGKIDDAQVFDDKLGALAEELAYAEVARAQEAADNDPEGDGWGLCAAESGLSSHDYFKTRVWSATDRILRELQKLDVSVLRSLVAITVDADKTKAR